MVPYGYPDATYRVGRVFSVEQLRKCRPQADASSAGREEACFQCVVRWLLACPLEFQKMLINGCDNEDYFQDFMLDEDAPGGGGLTRPSSRRKQ